MCGVFAAFAKYEFPQEIVQKALDQMAARGPDGQGQWSAPGVQLGHRRLAILDLDPRAAQPMLDGNDRYVITYNGEIYNFQELRRQLEQTGIAFRTTSDTEVILALFATEGEAMLPKLHGMFAFVIWDRLTKRAFAARDPYGIKPLYLATLPTGVLLASQVKALIATGLISREPDLRGQAGFWMLGSVPEPHTWYRDIHAVPAGHCLWIADGQVTRQRCWQDIGDAWRQADHTPAPPAQEVREHVRQALRETVARHLVADVPVGVFLSGGIDSGTLAGLMVEAGARDLQGVTIAYDEFSGQHHDEAPVAAQIAAHFGIRHHVRRVTRDEFLADIPRILSAMDQPSLDGVNTWYASKAVAEQGLKVVVSGVGGDELFLGYGHFRQLPRLIAPWRRLAPLPGMQPLARGIAAFQAQRSRNARWAHAPDWFRTVAGAWWLRRSVHSPGELTALMGPEAATQALAAFRAEEWVHGMAGPLPQDLTLALAQIESMTYLRNQLLRDSDWASMAHSVELRTPLVDANLLQILGHQLKAFKDFSAKSLLAMAPSKALPPSILQRKKTGFTIPVQHWLAEAQGVSLETTTGLGGCRPWLTSSEQPSSSLIRNSSNWDPSRSAPQARPSASSN